MRTRWAALVWLTGGWLAGCGDPPEPILSALPPSAPGGSASAPAAPGAPYTRPVGVEVDFPWLAGRPWEEVRDLVSAQLGDIEAVDARRGADRAIYTLERGEVELDRGRVVRLRYTFARPTRRGAALQAVNLPVTVDGWFTLTGEFRLRWEAGFERVRMGREPGDPDRVLWVEARKWDPRDGPGG